MDIVRLRIMTKKSILDIGRFKGKTVENVLNSSSRGYLTYLYYSYANITFTEEILDELKILKEYRIQKPGINKNEFATRQYLLAKRHNKEGQLYGYKRREKKLKLRMAQDSENWSKAKLQAANHGHL